MDLTTKFIDLVRSSGSDDLNSPPMTVNGIRISWNKITINLMLYQYRQRHEPHIKRMVYFLAVLKARTCTMRLLPAFDNLQSKLTRCRDA